MGVLKIAKENGFEITEADVTNHFRKDEEKGIVLFSDETLEKVCGGKIKDTEDKEWWEYAVDTLDAIAKGFGHCFTAESLVATTNGEKAIKDIKVGDKVMSLDTNGKKRIATVVSVLNPEETEIVEVTFENNQKVNTTKTQWFYCGDDDYANVIKNNGKKALTYEGKKVGVANVKLTGKKEMVYDFVVDGLNVFYVNGIIFEGYSLS